MTAASDLAARLADSRERFLGYIRSRVADPELAEDILQASLLKAVQGASKLKDQGLLGALVSPDRPAMPSSTRAAAAASPGLTRSRWKSTFRGLPTTTLPLVNAAITGPGSEARVCRPHPDPGPGNGEILVAGGGFLLVAALWHYFFGPKKVTATLAPPNDPPIPAIRGVRADEQAGDRVSTRIGQHPAAEDFCTAAEIELIPDLPAAELPGEGDPRPVRLQQHPLKASRFADGHGYGARHRQTGIRPFPNGRFKLAP